MAINPDEDTEFNDALRKHGILPPKPAPPRTPSPPPSPSLEEMLEGYSPSKLKGLAEDVIDDDEARAIESYRRQRLEEMRAEQKRSRFGEVYPIGRDDYKREVTEASAIDEEDEDMKGKGTGVVCFLYKEGQHVPSVRTFQQLRTLAAKHPRTKFVSIVGDKCIPNYPDKHLPTIFIYRKGELVHQEVAWGAVKERSIEDLENLLVRTGAVMPHEKPLSRYQELDLEDDELEEDDEVRGSKSAAAFVNAGGPKNIRGPARLADEDDSDFDL